MVLLSWEGTPDVFPNLFFSFSCTSRNTQVCVCVAVATGVCVGVAIEFGA